MLLIPYLKIRVNVKSIAFNEYLKVLTLGQKCMRIDTFRKLLLILQNETRPLIWRDGWKETRIAWWRLENRSFQAKNNWEFTLFGSELEKIKIDPYWPLIWGPHKAIKFHKKYDFRELFFTLELTLFGNKLDKMKCPPWFDPLFEGMLIALSELEIHNFWEKPMGIKSFRRKLHKIKFDP